MWDCENCGCKNIMDLPDCPMCRSPRPVENVPAAPANTQEESVPSSADSEVLEPQAPSKGKSSAKDK